MQAFSSKYIFDGKDLLANKAVVVHEGVITDIVAKNTIAKNLLTDYSGGVIIPGFIDLQLNGCGGVLFNEALNQQTLEIMYQTCLNYGTTSFLPTLITSSMVDMIKALETIKNWFKQYGNKRGVLGLHLEGPFISPHKCGIHSPHFILKPHLSLLKQIVSYTQFFPIKMTIAVEEFSPQQIKFLADSGIILSIGHSNASYYQVVKGIKLGIVTATHVFNAMSGLTGRNPGVIGAVLNSNIYAGVIADLLHVDAPNIELLARIKANQVYLVTDAVTPTGTNLKNFTLVGKQLQVQEGKCVDNDGVLGGAYLTMNQAVKNCVKKCNINLTTALNMASLIPAQVMRLGKTLGQIKIGYRANLVHMDLNYFSCQLCL